MSEEEKAAREDYLLGLRESFISQYKNAFNVSVLESELILAFHKIDIAYSEISDIQDAFLSGEVPLEAASVAVEVILGGLLGVKKGITEALKL